MQVQIHPNQLQSVWSHNSNHLNRFSSHFSCNTIIGCSVLTHNHAEIIQIERKFKSFNCIKFRCWWLIFAHKNNLTFSVWKKTKRSVSETVLAASLTKWNILHLRLCMPNMYTRNEQNSPSGIRTKFKTRHNSNIQLSNITFEPFNQLMVGRTWSNKGLKKLKLQKLTMVVCWKTVWMQIDEKSSRLSCSRF